MNGFKRIKINIPEYVDWDSFEIKDMEATQVTIYVHNLKKDATGDIAKIKILESMNNLENLTICSDDFNVGIYMSELTKNIQGTKEFNLLDDFENKDRSYIDATKIAKGIRFRTMPNSYIQWNGNKKNLNYGFKMIEGCAVVQFDTADASYSYPSEEALKEIDRIINQFMEIPDLTLVDKVVLVSNYLQQNVQFVEGKISYASDGEYVCEDYSYEKYDGVNTVDNVLFDKIGKCNCISRTMMLMLNNPKMNVNCRIANAEGHAYCSIYDEETGELYCIDPTWCISRNPNRFEGTLKASQFSDEYLLIGEDKLSTMSHHETLNVLQKPFAKTSMDRGRIRQSIQKLQQYGISFEYPKEIPLASKKMRRQLKNDTDDSSEQPEL